METRPGSYRDAQMSELEIQMKNGTPEKCITLSHSSPSIKMFYALRTRLENCSEEWLHEFLELDGLDSMLDSLYHMTGKGFTSFSDAILQLDCVSCIRAILNTNIGLDFMVRHDFYTPKLALALNMGNTLPKKQVYEMLSAICAYNSLGYNNIMNALNQLKKETDQTYRFSIIVNELKAAETVPHKTAIVTFINCVINCTPDVVERNRIRNEFIGLHLLDVFSFLRKEEVDDDLHLQLELFHEKKHEDEETLNKESEIDYNSPEDLIDLIQCKIFGTSKMVSFINVLQDLLSIETIHSKNGVKLWKSIDNLVHQAIHTCDINQVTEATETPMMELKSLPDHVHKGLEYIQGYQSNSMSPCHQRSLNMKDNMKNENDTGVELTHNMETKCKKFDNVTDMASYMDQSQYDNVFYADDNVSSETCTPTNKSALQRRYKIRKQPVPSPVHKVKNVPWIKLPDEVIDKHGDCLWITTADEKPVLPDYNQLQKLFQQAVSDTEVISEVILLNPRTRKNINLFLSRMEIGPEQLIECLEQGTPDIISLPTLQYLLKVLPEPQEISMLQGYRGRRLELGMPEQFVLLLADIPDYEVLIQGHLTKAESFCSMQKLKASLSSMTTVCKVLLEDKHFKEFLHFVLHAGNFLNHGCVHGDAGGIKLSSLERLMEVKSGVPNQSLLHHIIKLASELDDNLLKFLPAVASLDKATTSSLSDLKVEINKFNKQLCQFVHHLSTSNIKLRERFHVFIEEVKLELLTIQSATNHLRSLTEKVANFFCEDIRRFDLEEALKCLQRFCKQIRRCQRDNATFQKQASLAKKKNDQIKCHVRHKFLALEFGKDAGASSSILEDKNKLLEKILDELHRGNFHPVIKSEIQTPDTEIEPLEFSNISFVGSPYIMRPSSEVLEDDFLTPPHQNINFRTSSAADILSEEPFTKAHEVTLTHFPRVSQTEVLPSDKRVDVLKQQSRQRGHNRSRSDLTDSILVTEKWMKYEEIRHQESLLEEGSAPLAEPESLCNVTSLNLENHGKSVDRVDVKYYEEQKRHDPDENVCLVQEGPIVRLPTGHLQLPELGNTENRNKREEKRSSVSNFFTKISRAVLKPKNTYHTESNERGGKPRKEKFGRFGRKKLSSVSSDNKENVPMSDKTSLQASADKKFAAREYKRFKAEKNKATRQNIAQK